MFYHKFLAISGAVGITAVGLFLLAPPASGKTAPVVVTGHEDIISRHISYADLNLASAAGERTLNSRVGGAIIGLCNDVTTQMSGSYWYRLIDGRCTAAAWSQATPQIATALERARGIAFNGASNLAAAQITISVP